MTTVAEVAGIINPECAYTTKELAARLEVTEETIADWKREGLPVHVRKKGSKVQIVLGHEFLAWYTGAAQ